MSHNLFAILHNLRTSTIPIGHARRQDNLTALANFHLAKLIVPSTNNLSGTNLEDEWPAPITTRIKFLIRVKAVEPSRVMRLDTLSGSRDRAIAFFKDLVLDSILLSREIIGCHGARGCCRQ